VLSDQPTAAETSCLPDTQPDTPPDTEIAGKRAEAGVYADAVKAQLAKTNMDGTDRTTPGVNKSVDFEHSPEFQALPQPVRDHLLKEIANDPSIEFRLNQVIQRPLYDKLSTDQRTKLLNVFAGADEKGRQELVTLMTRKLDSGVPALLSSDNSTYASLLDNLDKLATQPLAPGLGGRRSEILGQVIADTAQPTWYMNQGDVGTCAPTSFQTHLLVDAPSEYVRLLGGLLGPDRKATFANGDTMAAARNDLATPPTVTVSRQATVNTPGGTIPLPYNQPVTIPDRRSLTERIFQSSLAQYAYKESGRQSSVDANGDIPGLTLDESASAMSALYNRDYDTVGGGMLGMPAFLNIQDQLKNGHGPVPVSLSWGGGHHQLLVDHIQQDAKGNLKIYVRNPWGSSDAQSQPYRDGQQLGSAANNNNSGPLRTVADHQSGLEVMDFNDFRTALYGAVLEK
jgi:hypothetical protein